MTPLKKNVTRGIELASAVGCASSLVVRMSPEGLYVKESGQRWSSAYLVPWMAIYHLGARLRAQNEQVVNPRRRVSRGLLR